MDIFTSDPAMASVDTQTRWKHCIAPIEISPTFSIRLAYIDCSPPSTVKKQGTIVLLHGFPQTSYQFRHVITPLADAGYRILAPDYRGAGASSKPDSGFTKSVMAEDIKKLIEYLSINEPIHLVGHDIGGMIAFAFASRYPDLVASVAWGECPLPGTSVYDVHKTELAVQQFHFIFHNVLDLPEALVAGRERIYLSHFFSKIVYNTAAISSADLDYYTEMYSQPGAMRCAFNVYRAFEQDAVENRQWLKENGKYTVATMIISGEMSRHKDEAKEMVREVHDGGELEIAVVEDCAHYLAEENPNAFIREILRFVRKHPTL